MKFKIEWLVRDCLIFQSAMRISRIEGDADGGGRGPSTGEGLAETGSEVETFG